MAYAGYRAPRAVRAHSSFIGQDDFTFQYLSFESLILLSIVSVYMDQSLGRPTFARCSLSHLRALMAFYLCSAPAESTLVYWDWTGYISC